MGVNNPTASPASPSQPVQQINPQQAAQLQRIRALQGMALTPYQGSAAGGAGAQGIAQLAAALMARRRQQALLAGNPGGTQQPLPVGTGAPAPAPTAPADPAGLMAPG